MATARASPSIIAKLNEAMSDQPVPTPYVGYSVVKPAWLDANGHMNVAHYVSAYDDGSCPMFDDFGLGWDYTGQGVASMFMVSSSIDFRRELMAGDPLEMSTLLLGYDRRRVHIFQELYHRNQRYLSAQAEFVFVHIDFATRRASVMPARAQQRLAAIQAEHTRVLRPAFVGRAIGLDWKPA